MPNMLLGCGPTGAYVPLYDYLITNDTTWNSVFGLGPVTLSGKTIGISGEVSARTLSTFNPAAQVTLLGLSGCSIPQLTLANVSKLTCKNVLFQHKAWPRAATEIVRLNSGTFDDLVFDGCTFRHGYGPTNLDLDPLASYPEYNRIDNVTNATTTSTRIALTFQDPTATDAFVEFFNRGSANVYFKLGDANVVATASDTLAAPSTEPTRSISFNPQTTTHIAVISVSGTQQINARTEIGLTEYLTAAFASSGGLTVGDVTIKNCLFTDLNNAAKGIGTQTPGSTYILMDCETRRVYQDQSAISGGPGVTYFILRNIFEMPIARSGRAENLSGDARDPHGDLMQSFGTGAGAIGPVYSAGNMVRIPPRRSGAVAQGMFYSDNDTNPNYDRIFSIADNLSGGATRGISIGEASGGYYHRRGLIFGATVFDTTNLSNNNAGIQAQASSDEELAIIDTVTANITSTGQAAPLQSGNVLLPSTAVPASCFPNIGTLSSASTRTQLNTAFTTAAEAANKGAVAKATAIDWTTFDHTAVIKWENVHPGVTWTNQADVQLNTLVTFPLRRILNERANQTVVPTAGVEWRAVGTDKTTEVQAWTNLSGTIQPNQYIQYRAYSSPLPSTTVSPGLTINGFLCNANITTIAAFAARAVYFDGATYWRNQSVTGLTGSSQGTLSVWFRHQGATVTGRNTISAYIGGTLAFAMSTTSSNRMTFRLNQDGTGTDTWTTPSNTIMGDTWYHALWSWNWALSRFQVYINNVAQNTSAYLFSGATKFDLDGAGLTQHGIACVVSPGSFWVGDIGHLYVNFETSLDLSVQANREKFALGGVPVNLGVDGSIPTGVQPAYYWDGTLPNWDNKGTVADGVLTGSMSASSSTPSY